MSRSRTRSRSHNRKRALPPPAQPAPVAERPARSDGAATNDSAPPRKRRLRSSYVILGSVGTLFVGLCVYGVFRDRDRDRTCVDANNYVVADRECERVSSGARWYYGGSNHGGRMSGGSFERGGFGGHGGGGS